MIHIFPAQFVNQITKIQARRITFEIDDANKELSKEIGNSSQGANFLIVAYDMSDMDSISAIHANPDGGRNNMMKQVHAKVGDYVTITGVNKDTILNLLRIRLQHRGNIKKSLSELDEFGLAQAVYILTTELNPNKFNYAEYAKEEKHKSKPE